MTNPLPGPQDKDPIETQEGMESIDAVVELTGPDRARYLLDKLLERARVGGYQPDIWLGTDYVNTIPVEQESAYPGDEEMEDRINDLIRWNAAVMVSRTNRIDSSLGGHIALRL